MLCALGEEKNLLNFNDKSVCQAIGYHIAARVGIRSRDSLEGQQTPLAILFCGSQLWFIFFAFYKTKLLVMT